MVARRIEVPGMSVLNAHKGRPQKINRHFSSKCNTACTVLKLQPHSTSVLYVHNMLSSTPNHKAHKRLWNLKLQYKRRRAKSLYLALYTHSSLICTLPLLYQASRVKDLQCILVPGTKGKHTISKC